jgi:RecA-family ATPase
MNKRPGGNRGVCETIEGYCAMSLNHLTTNPSSGFAGLPENIPALNELKKINQWVAWKLSGRDKIPVNPHTGWNGSHSKPETWGTYQQALARAQADNLPGVGFVWRKGGNLTAWDLDKCRNPETGWVKPWAREIIELNETYAELSQSGTGFHIIARGELTNAVKFDPAKVEGYSDVRFFTFTGQKVEGALDTINLAPLTKAACRKRHELHKETWAKVKAAAPIIFEAYKRKTKLDRETWAAIDADAPNRFARAPKAPPPKPGGIIAQATGATVIDLSKAPRQGSSLFDFGRDPFWRNVNTAALENLSAWVPDLFGADAKVAPNSGYGGYRVTSAALGRALEEDLAITPKGIVDWGVDDINTVGKGQKRPGGYTPIALVMECKGDTATDAARWLCERLGKRPEDYGWKNHKERERQEESGPLPFINITDWDTKQVPERLWAVDGLIPLLQTYLFTGNGAVGKSLVELMRLVAHVLGKPWLGIPVTQGPAIYLGAEDDEDELHRRLVDILKYYEASFADLAKGGLHLLSYVGEDCLLAVPDKGGIIRPTSLTSRLEEAAMDIKPVAVSIDTVADVFGGNEIDRAQVTGFVKMLQGCALRARCSVSVLAHPSVAGMSTGSGLSGSTAWHNKVRARAYMRAPETPKGEEIDSDLREIEFKKNNYGPQGDTIQVRWEKGVFVPVIAPTGLDKAAADEQDDALFLKLLESHREQKIFVSNSSHAQNYAPKVFAAVKREQKVSRQRHEQAMRRLWDANRLRLESWGPPSRQRFILVVGPRF